MPSALEAESWTWYGICLVVVAARMLSRRLLLGSFRSMQIDDLLMLFAACTYTVLTVTINITADAKSNLIDPDENVVLDKQEISDRVYGSKMTLVVEQCMCWTIWTIKACLLIMYGRLTMSLKQHLFVKIAAGYVAFTFVFMEIFYFAVWCRPFPEYWAVPTDSTQCSAATDHLITNAVFNISSDLAIISIPLPVVFKAQLPFKKKAILGGIFGLGSFTILSAILNKYYSFTEPFGSLWTFWYVREVSTAILTANIPFTWTLLQKAFNVRSFAGSGRGRTRTTTNYHQFSGEPSGSRTTNPHASATLSGHHFGGDRGRKKDVTVVDVERDSSQEAINKGDIPLEIWQNVQFSTHITRREDGKNDPSHIHVEEKIFDGESHSSGSASGDVGVAQKGLDGRLQTHCIGDDRR